MIPLQGIIAEKRLRLKRKISQMSRVGFNMFFQLIGTKALHQNVISSDCGIRDHKVSQNAIWEKYDS